MIAFEEHGERWFVWNYHCWYTGTGYGYSMHRLSERLLHQFSVFNIATPTDSSLRAIYSRAMQSTLDSFVSSQFHHHSEFVEVVLLCRCSCPCLFAFYFGCFFMPSVLWRCWLGGKKGIHPVKTEWWDTGMVILRGRGANDLQMVQLMPLSPHHLLLQQNPEWFTFLVPAYPGWPEKRPLNGCTTTTTTLLHPELFSSVMCWFIMPWCTVVTHYFFGVHLFVKFEWVKWM